MDCHDLARDQVVFPWHRKNRGLIPRGFTPFYFPFLS